MLSDRVSTGPGMVTPVVGVLTQHLDTLTLNPAEVDTVFTVTLSELCDDRHHGYTQFRASPEWGVPGMCLPVYWAGPHSIWGLTALITYNFLNILVPNAHEIHIKV